MESKDEILNVLLDWYYSALLSRDNIYSLDSGEIENLDIVNVKILHSVDVLAPAFFVDMTCH